MKTRAENKKEKKKRRHPVQTSVKEKNTPTYLQHRNKNFEKKKSFQ